MNDLNLQITYQKHSDDLHVLRGVIGSEHFNASYASAPTFAQVGTFASNCVVRFLSRDWADTGSNR